jgi:hypothetical protein
MAGGTIGSLAVNVVGNTGPFRRDMRAARTELGLFQSAVGGLNRVMAGFGAAMAASFTIGSFRATIRELDELGDTAKRLGTSVESLSRLQHAGFLADVQSGELSRALTYMQKNLGMNSAEIRRFGLDIDHLRRLDATEMFIQIAEAINRMPDAAAKTAAAMAVFGRSGADLLELIGQGRAGIEGAMKEASWAPSEADIEKIEKADKALKKFAAEWKLLRSELVTEVLPENNEAETWVTKAILFPVQDALNKIKMLKLAMAELREAEANSGSIRDQTRVDLGLIDETQTGDYRRAEADAMRRRDDIEASVGVAREALAARRRLNAPNPFDHMWVDDGLKKFQAELPKVVEELKRFGKALDPRNAFKGIDSGSALGSFLAPTMMGMDAAMRAATGVSMMAPGIQGGPNPRGFEALEAGTAEAFRQERRSATQNVGRETIDLQRQELKKLDEILNATKQNKPQVLQAANLT